MIDRNIFNRKAERDTDKIYNLKLQNGFIVEVSASPLNETAYIMKFYSNYPITQNLK